MKCPNCGKSASNRALICPSCGQEFEKGHFETQRTAVWLLRMVILAYLLIGVGRFIVKLVAPEHLAGNYDDLVDTVFYWGVAFYALLALTEVAFLVVFASGVTERSNVSVPKLGSELEASSLIAMILSGTRFIAGNHFPLPGDELSFGISFAISTAIFGVWTLIEKLGSIKRKTDTKQSS